MHPAFSLFTFDFNTFNCIRIIRIQQLFHHMINGLPIGLFGKICFFFFIDLFIQPD